MSRIRLFSALAALITFASACSGASPDIASSAGAGIEESTTSTSVSSDDSTDSAVQAEQGGGEDESAMGEDEQDSTASTLVDQDAELPDGATPNVDIPPGVPAEAAAELGAAALAGNELRFASPYFYITVEQDCEGCAGIASLYYVPRDDNPSRHRLAGVYVDSVEQPLHAAASILQTADPLFIAEDLMAEIDGGATVTYRVDPVSGLVASWSVDGQQASVRCFQVDTRPLSMRDELCSGSLMG